MPSKPKPGCSIQTRRSRLGLLWLGCLGSWIGPFARDAAGSVEGMLRLRSVIRRIGLLCCIAEDVRRDRVMPELCWTGLKRTLQKKV